MKRYLKRVIALMLVLGTVALSASNAEAASWRSTNSKTVSGKTLTAKANLPYFSDLKGGGAWKTQAVYSGKKDNDKLTTSWAFTSIGGSVSWNGLGISGSGTNSGNSFTAKASTVNANGYVYGTGFCLYVGMISTASFSKGNTFYSTSCKI